MVKQYPVSYHIQGGMTSVVANKKENEYSFNLTFADGSKHCFTFVEGGVAKETTEGAMFQHYEIEAMNTLWKMEALN